MKPLYRFAISLFCKATILICSTTIISSNTITAQVNLDSLWGVWNDETQSDTSKLKAMFDISWHGYLFTKPDSAFYFAQMQYDLAEKNENKKRMASALNTQSVSFHLRGQFDNAIIYQRNSLKIKEEIGDSIGISASYGNIGLIYKAMGDTINAIKYYKKGLRISEDLEYLNGISSSLSNLGNIYSSRGNYSLANDFYHKSLMIAENQGNKYSMANTLNNIGHLHHIQGDLAGALLLFKKSLKLREEIENSLGVINSLINIGSVYKDLGDIQKALMNTTKAFDLSKGVDISNELDATNTLCSIYEDLGNYKSALLMQKHSVALRDSIYKEENQREVIRQEYKHEYEKDVLAKEIEHAAELKVQTAKLEQARTQRYALFGGIGLVLIFAFILYRRFRKTQEQKLLIEKQKEQVEGLMESRTSLVRSLTHSIKSPLTTISLANEASSSNHAQNDLEVKNTKRIKSSIGRITRRLDHLNSASALDQGNLILNKRTVNLRNKLIELTDEFRPQLKHRGMILNSDIPDESVLLRLDWPQMEMALENLIDNATKYNPEGTEIRVSMKYNSNENEMGILTLTVGDNGVGIPVTERKKILDFGYRIKTKNIHGVQGSGIGLYHVNEVVKLHQGTFEIKCPPGGGTLFKISVPVNIVTGMKQEIGSSNTNYGTDGTNQTKDDLEKLSLAPNANAPTLLLVDDEPELLHSIGEALSPTYTIITASNGVEAFTAAIEHSPDLVITDVNMPEMDGFELCEKLKADDATSHIPVIMLTALSDDEKRLEGLRIGADDFIGKPFRISELILRIKTILKWKTAFRKEILQSISNNEDSKAGKESSVNSSISAKVRQLIIENIDDDEFNVDQLCAGMDMSRSKLERNLKKELTMTPNNMIKEVRLTYSMRLLKNKEIQISEIAIKSGYPNVQYFKKVFTSFFKLTPEAYQDNWEKFEQNPLSPLT